MNEPENTKKLRLSVGLNVTPEGIPNGVTMRVGRKDIYMTTEEACRISAALVDACLYIEDALSGQPSAWRWAPASTELN
jgi:hypothetical protein